MGLSFFAMAGSLSGMVGDYLFNQRIRTDRTGLESLAVRIARDVDNSNVPAIRESLSLAAGELGGRIMLLDENGKAYGGKAGDQTGKEVSTQSWYKHNKGWRVFRAKDPAVAARIAQDMQWACDNKHIGYDQGQRLTLYDVSKPLGFNCKNVTTNCETDCSALVRVCCAYAGVMLPNFRTPTEPAALLDSGNTPME